MIQRSLLQFPRYYDTRGLGGIVRVWMYEEYILCFIIIRFLFGQACYLPIRLTV